MLKYVQTQIPVPLYKRLRIEALERDMGLGDLLQEILTAYDSNRKQEKTEETKDGKKTEKRSVGKGTGKNQRS